MGWTTTASRDGDGAGDDNVTQPGCVPPAAGAWVLQGGDCDDNDATRFPGNPELCDGIDNDCDPTTPDAGSVTYYYDGDSDGYGDDNTALISCFPQPAPWVLTGGDCNDSSAAIHPGAIELCDWIDNNCVDGVDEGTIATWPDVDGDGFGDQSATAIYLCEVKPGTAGNNADCDDGNPGIAPGAPEIPGNGVDEDCDGADSALGTTCGYDGEAAASLPYTLDGSLDGSDEVDNGPRGTGFYWDDVEIGASAFQDFTVLYASYDPFALRPQLYTYGPNSCTAQLGVASGNSYGSPKGNYRAYQLVTNPSPGYYYSALTSYSAGQLGDYLFEVIPGSMPQSCGSDSTFIWPLGWRSNGSLSTFDVESPTDTPVLAGHYADDYEFYLAAGITYSVLMGDTSFNGRLLLARAGACDVELANGTAGPLNPGARIVFTPTQSDVYVAYLTTDSAGVTGTYTFNVGFS